MAIDCITWRLFLLLPVITEYIPVPTDVQRDTRRQKRYQFKISYTTFYITRPRDDSEGLYTDYLFSYHLSLSQLMPVFIDQTEN